jgi:ribonucleoside-diphosphate reductase subunit M2
VAVLQAILLESPTKLIHKSVSIINDARRSPSPLLETAEDQELILHKCYIGNIDLPESTSGNCLSYLPLTSFVGQEPLLMESKHRFVLFPIQYHEVSPRYHIVA